MNLCPAASVRLKPTKQTEPDPMRRNQTRTFGHKQTAQAFSSRHTGDEHRSSNGAGQRDEKTWNGEDAVT